MPRPSDSDTLKDIIALTKYTMGFVPFTFIDFIDIILVAAIMFWIYRATRGTNAPYIISGIIMIYLMWVVVRTLNMELLSNILGQFVSVGVIALIIVFQPEIRRFLQMIGMRQKRFNFIARIFNRNDNTSVTIIAPIVQACREMSAHKTGALIVIGRQSDLRLITEGGIAIDAKISTPLLENIFFKNAPLHDGAVVIEGDRIVAAKCILPVTQSDVPKSYGTRHRAAIGMSEISDAIILVVSEETGGISIAHGGTIHRDIAPDQLANLLQRHFGANRQKAVTRRWVVRHSSHHHTMLLPSPTDRLILRCWQDEDFPAFARMNADSRVMEYFPAPLSLPESAAFFDRIRREFETEGFGLYALERRTDGELLGYTGLHRVTFDGPLYGRVEIGWRLRSDMWGNGYATEAARSCLHYASLSKMESIISFTALSNLRSQRVMQRLGMTRLQEFDHPALPTGHPLRRHVLYMIRTSGYAETEPETRPENLR